MVSESKNPSPSTLLWQGKCCWPTAVLKYYSVLALLNLFILHVCWFTSEKTWVTLPFYSLSLPESHSWFGMGPIGHGPFQNLSYKWLVASAAHKEWCTFPISKNWAVLSKYQVSQVIQSSKDMWMEVFLLLYAMNIINPFFFFAHCPNQYCIALNFGALKFCRCWEFLVISKFFQ